MTQGKCALRKRAPSLPHPSPLFYPPLSNTMSTSITRNVVAGLALAIPLMAPGAAAFGVADTFALLIGLALLFIMICAGLGWYSRRV
ncbi:hypothetical protein H696_00859 [Fonticula alba]|uniref:Uncharacterized protein n=1 Tax=Fonticula alba TaxID=691883 RepID=A0A058ZHA2_FONAL|nr:hypothetical protein H696_00859 [Fonticula alba]KCV73318.1 hypothetical protein H696_00859 [Fonticula alba]|eukprot:XP_009493019.1 hypothetical protein H696_00859 [Fonticula alba]